MEYKYDVDLKKITSIKTAIQLWECHEIKEVISSYFLYEYRSYDPNKNGRIWAEISDQVQERVSQLQLPQTVAQYTKKVVSALGYNILHWLEYLTVKLNVCNYVIATELKLLWLPDGRLDKIGMFKEYMSNPGELTKEGLFILGSNLCVEDDLPALWNNLPLASAQSCFFKIAVYSHYGHHLTAYWKFKCDNDEQAFRNIQFSDFENMYADGHTFEEFMFRNSIFQGHELAVKYFWSKMTDAQRDVNLSFGMETIIKNILGVSKFMFFIYNEYIDIFVFLFAKLTDIEKLSIFTQDYVGIHEHDQIFKVLKTTWPYEGEYAENLVKQLNLLTGVYSDGASTSHD